MTDTNPVTQAILQMADHCRAVNLRVTGTPPTIRDNPTWQKQTIAGLDALAQAILNVCALRTQAGDNAVTTGQPDSTAYYGLEYQDQLHATSLEEAVIEQLEPLQPEDYPKTLAITRFRRADLKHGDHRPLENLLEHLDEQYGDPNSDPTQETRAMRTAEKAFVATILQEFHIWRCDPVESTSIDVRKWLDQNAQHTGLPPWPRPRPTQTQLCGHCYQPTPMHILRTCRNCRRRGCPTCRTGRAHSALMQTEALTTVEWQRAREAWLSLCRFVPIGLTPPP